MSDPLIQLRDCILNNKDIREEEDNVHLGEDSWPKSTITSFKSSGKSQNPEEPYTLDALLFFLKNSSLPHVTYFNKAQTLGIQHVKRFDRKNLLKFLTGSADNKTEVTPVDSNKRSPSTEDKSRPCKKPRIDKTRKKIKSSERLAAKGSEKDSSIDKPSTDVPNFDEPISSRPIDDGPSADGPNADEPISDDPSPEEPTSDALTSVVASSHVQSSDEPSINDNGTTSATTQTDPDNQPATIQAYQVIISRLIKFLQDDLGLSREEQESVLEGKKISLRRVMQRTKTQRCFVAVPHPIHEWDTVKDDGAHVVSGQRINRKADDIERRYQCVLDNCLKRGEADLKDSLSLLISHMRDLNKSNLSETEVEVSCKRTLEYCLTSAQEDFREMFESLLSVVDDNSEDMQLQRWISESEVELRKLLNSLMLSLQTLRDVSACSRTLFHFPEPIVSIALNPTKVTHSVVLEIYVRLGLAELRRILVNIISSIEKARTTVEGNLKRQQSDSEEVDDPDEVASAQAERPASAASSSDPGQSTDTPSTRLVESIKNEWSVDEPEGSSSLRRKGARRRSAEQETPSGSAKADSTAQKAADAFWKSAEIYSSFKTTIGNTLVTSFKKRIQEKIEASATTEECISWLRTKKGLIPNLNTL